MHLREVFTIRFEHFVKLLVLKSVYFAKLSLI